MFDFAKEEFGGIDVCINNAGLVSHTPLLKDSPQEWRRMLDLNVVALCLCSQLAVKSMKEKGADDGYIINLGSLSGHVVHDFDCLHFYQGTKFAVRALTEGLRQELRQQKSGIRVSLISPGPVVSDMTGNLSSDNSFAQALSSMTLLKQNDIADVILQILTLDPNVEIHDTLVIPRGTF